MSTQAARTRIQEASEKLTEEILAIFAEEVSSFAQALAAPGTENLSDESFGNDLGQDLVSTGAPTPPQETATKTRVRRTGVNMAAAMKNVTDLLRRNTDGLRVEQINSALGMAPKELALPIQKMLAVGSIRKSGTRRATRYFLA